VKRRNAEANYLKRFACNSTQQETELKREYKVDQKRRLLKTTNIVVTLLKGRRPAQNTSHVLDAYNTMSKRNNADV
jgi:hypothetical protein